MQQANFTKWTYSSNHRGIQAKDSLLSEYTKKYKLHLHADPKTECFHTGLFIILFQCFGVSREVRRGCSLNPLGGEDRRVVFLILFIAAVIIWVTTVISFDMSATWRNLSRKPFWMVDIA